jgi:transposase InsO family protein
MKFSFIDEERNNFTVGAMCRVLEVSRQGYYAWRSRPTSKHKLRDAELAEKIINLHTTHWGVYGAPRIHALLKREGIHTSRKRVARLMVENNLCGVSKRLKPKQNKQKPECDNANDLVKRDFHADKPNKIWFADITYVKTHQGWLYLAVVFDIFSRMIVGWSMGDHIDAKLADNALLMGINRRSPGKGLIHHSDHGSQYRSLLIGETMKKYNVVPSMGAIASPWDNAVTESLMSTIKSECVHCKTYKTKDEAAVEIFEYIESFYNRLRLHSALGYMSPLEYEQAYEANKDAA